MFARAVGSGGYIAGIEEAAAMDSMFGEGVLFIVAAEGEQDERVPPHWSSRTALFETTY